MNNKIIIKIIFTAVLILLILNFFVVLIHYNEECNHSEECPICTLVYKYKSEIKILSFNVLKLFFSFLLIIFIKKYIYVRLFDKKCETLIGLKVQLNIDNLLFVF